MEGENAGCKQVDIWLRIPWRFYILSVTTELLDIWPLGCTRNNDKIRQYWSIVLGHSRGQTSQSDAQLWLVTPQLSIIRLLNIVNISSLSVYIVAITHIDSECNEKLHQFPKLDWLWCVATLWPYTNSDFFVAQDIYFNCLIALLFYFKMRN